MNNKNAFISIVIVFLLSVSPAFAKNENKPPDPTKQTIGDLSCPNGHVAKFNQSLNAWECAEDIDTNDGDTLGGLSCATDEIAKSDGAGDWSCQADDTGGGGAAGTTYVVKDNSGAVIGQTNASDLPRHAKTVVDISGSKVPVIVSRTTIAPSLIYTVLYDDTDCAGTQWVPTWEIGDYFPAYSTVFGEGRNNLSGDIFYRIHGITSFIPTTDLAVKSYSRSRIGRDSIYCSNSEYIEPSVYPLQEFVSDLSTLYLAPYTVEEQ